MSVLVKTSTTPTSCYDAVADSYDARYDNPLALAEDKAVFDRLGRLHNAVLDVGCGTGLFLRNAYARSYLGIDPSAGMLDRLVSQFPDANTMQTTFDDFKTPAVFETVVSLYGAPSYIHPDHLPRLAKMAGQRLFLMFYADGYRPTLHEEIGNPQIYTYDGRFGVAETFQTFLIIDRSA